MNPVGKLRKAVLTAGMVTAVALTIAACGSSSNSKSGAKSTGSHVSHTYVDLVSAVPPSVDETQSPVTSSATLLPSWSSPLVRPAPGTPGANAKVSDSVVPYLATSWKVAANGDITFQLRHNVHGATGDLFTSADVVWSMHRAATKSLVAPFLLKVANINAKNPATALGKYAVRINVTAPSAVGVLVFSAFDVGIYDSKLYEKHATKADPWGTKWGTTHSATFGPYSVTSFVPSSKITLTANPGFWNKPYFTTVNITAVSDAQTAVEEVQSGGADHTSGVPWATFASLVKAKGASGVSASVLGYGANVESWYLVEKYKPLANKLVRQALNIGIDRTAIANSIYDGYAQADNETAPPIIGQAQTTGAGQAAAYNPTKAKALLAKAGYPNGFSIQVDSDAAVTDSSINQLLQLMQAQLAKIGVKMTIKIINSETQLYALEGALKDQSNVSYAATVLPSLGYNLEQAYNGDISTFGTDAYTAYDNQALNSVLNKALTLPKGSAYDALITKANAMVDDTLPIINLLAPAQQNITRSDITGYKVYTFPTVFYEALHPTS